MDGQTDIHNIPRMFQLGDKNRLNDELDLFSQKTDVLHTGIDLKKIVKHTQI